jgi:hypothetical protein
LPTSHPSKSDLEKITFSNESNGANPTRAKRQMGKSNKIAWVMIPAIPVCSE